MERPRPASTHSVYLTDELWERLNAIAQRVTGGSNSQLIENILQAQLPKIEACLEDSEGMGILLCPTCTTQ